MEGPTRDVVALRAGTKLAPVRRWRQWPWELLCGMVESQSWSLGVGEGPGIQGPLEALGKRGQNTQKASSASFLITFSPHTDYCLSCELFQRPAGIGGRAWAWPGYAVAQSFCILMFVRLGSRPSPVS